MREKIIIAIQDVLPKPDPVFTLQGFPPDVKPNARATSIYESALELLHDLAEPVAVWANITKEEFKTVYHGEGNNDPETPLEKIFPQADSFALFAATIGEAVCQKIATLFTENDFALGSMLDSVASVTTDLIGDRLEDHYITTFALVHEISDGKPYNNRGLMRYSPGYCGWHISAQGALFKALQPSDIGITLRESFLMQPLKSISGVMLAGRPEIHLFRPNYPFCAECCTKSCGDRIIKMKSRAAP